MKFKKFASFDEYEAWFDSFENASDVEQIPCMIDDGWKIAIDMMTECKSWKTAVRRFGKTFCNVSEDVDAWIEGMEESCSNGCFKDLTGWIMAGCNDPREISNQAKYGTYNWSVEEVSEGLWYIYLNISGGYAGRTRETA